MEIWKKMSVGVFFSEHSVVSALWVYMLYVWHTKALKQITDFNFQQFLNLLM